MRKAAAEMGIDDWHKALAKVKLANVPPGEQDDLVAKQGRGIVKFLKDRNLITIPPLAEETWPTEMSSLETQRYLPFAAYNEQAMTIGYPTDAMKHADKLVDIAGDDIHFTRLVTPHQFHPGHHLQIYMSRRERPKRGIFSPPPSSSRDRRSTWEMVLYNTDWPKGPEDRIGMLFWRMHRCARIIVSLKFHMEQMTPKEMIDFLVDRVGTKAHRHQRGSAAHRRGVLTALPVRVHDRRAPDPCMPAQARRARSTGHQPDEREVLSRPTPDLRPHPHRDGPRRPAQLAPHARLAAGLAIRQSVTLIHGGSDPRGRVRPA